MGDPIRFCAIGDCCADIYDDGRANLGGTAYNVALAAQRASAYASIFSAVGSDAIGAQILKSLEEKHIDTSHLSLVTGTTSSIPIHLDSQGRPQYGTWDLATMKNVHIKDSDIPFLKSHNVVRAVLFTPIQHLFDEFIRLKLDKSLKVGDFAGTSNDSIDVEMIQPYAKSLDIIIKSVEEPKEKSLAVLRSLAKRYGCLVLGLLGSSGSVVFINNKTFRQKTQPLRAKNTTGAGDVFQAFFLVEYSKTKNIEHALSVATAQATKTILV